MSTALVIIDIQNDYLPGGACELEGSSQAADKAGEALKFFRERGWPVAHIQHESLRPGSTFFLPGSPGMEIAPAVAPVSGETVFVKHYPNSFRETSLLHFLRDNGVKRLAICGMMTNMCLDATVRQAFDLGFECLVAHDCCAARDLEFAGRKVAAADVQAAFLAALGLVYAQILDLQSLLSKLQD